MVISELFDHILALVYCRIRQKDPPILPKIRKGVHSINLRNKDLSLEKGVEIDDNLPQKGKLQKLKMQRQ
jgi:hypothetical protein